MAFKFTKGQERAIHASGHDILVSASAGSGKTRVLVERVIDKIRHGTGVDRLLVLTFTEAAAREMKERIQKALRKTCSEAESEEERGFLLNQLVRLNTAEISTIDAFCRKFVQNYYYKADLDPSFRLLTDETEIGMLREEVLGDLLEKMYGSQDDDFIELAVSFSSDRSDDGLTSLITRVFDFASVNPDPEKWIENLPERYRMDGSFSESSFYRDEYAPAVAERLRGFAFDMTRVRDMMIEQDEGLFSRNIVLYNTEISCYESYAQLIESGADYGMVRSALYGMEFGRNTFRKSDDPVSAAVRESAKAVRDRTRKNFREKFLPAYFGATSEDLEWSLAEAFRIVRKLSEVVSDFSAAYQAEKKRRRMLEFSDLEHYTLGILRENEDIRRDLEDRYEEIMVDEYQDTNELQEAILTTIARKDPGNMFMVGDVKQSIYGFRLANPGLFLDKYRRYAEEGSAGERIILAENFRSVRNIASVTNLIFSQIMDVRVGEMDYDENARLVYGSSDYPEESPDADLLLYFDERAEDDEAKGTGKMRWDTDSVAHESMDADFTVESAAQGQMMMTAEKIRQLVDSGCEIYDRKLQRMRKVSWGDIAVLSSTRNNHLILSEELKRLGVPYRLQKSSNYFQTTELRIMMSLLAVIDNPRQDIPLAAVLRSPIVGLRENELARLRINDRSGDYYQALLNYQEADGLGEKVRRFLDRLDSFRTLARRNELSTLIWQIYDETNFLEYVSGMPGGSQRAANLHALYERAAAYEKTSFKGLFQFIRFISRMQEQDKDLASAVDEADSDVVNIMTIHGSKGLEFPIVFLIDAAKRFNTDGLKGRYLLDEHDGVAVTCLNRETRVETVTPMQTLARDKAARKLCAEQMRLLYVALTRAEQKLFIVAGAKSRDSLLEKWRQAAGNDDMLLNPGLRESATCYMDWIGPALYRERSFAGKFDCDDDIRPCHYLDKFSARYSFEMTERKDLNAAVRKGAFDLGKWYDEQKKTEIDADDADFINRMLTFRYPHEGLVQTAAYQSVSEIKAAFSDPDADEMKKLEPEDIRKGKARRYVSGLELPEFMRQNSAGSGRARVSAAAVGSAVHLVMEKIDLTKRPDEASVSETIAALTADGILAGEVAERIDVPSICRFFSTDLGRTVLERHSEVRREVPFSLLIPANELFSGLTGSDPVLVHGIIDGYIDDGESLILFDYKTDHVTDETIPAVTERYRGQLELYALALESILHRPVTEKCLYLFGAGKSVRC